MNREFQKGKLKRWNDDKGFGFIASENDGTDIFIHISALKKMARRPLIGDVVIYQTDTDKNGKKKAVNATIEGVKEIRSKSGRAVSGSRNASKLFSSIITLSLIILIGLFAFNNFPLKNSSQGDFIPSISFQRAEEENSHDYSCEGKIYCSEMTSCDEAKFYQRNCPGTKMDGDGDGIPCERQWCSSYW